MGIRRSLGIIGIVLWKEVVDNLRDRRSVTNALTTVLLNPILFIVLFAFIGRSTTGRAERPLQLPVTGAENAPRLVEYLQQNNTNILPAPDNPIQALRDGEVELILIIPEDYAADFSNGQPVQLQLLYDASQDGSSVTLQRAQRLLERYSSQLGSLRLLARGISPSLVSPLVVERRDVARQAAGFQTLTLLPTIMLIAAFFGGFYLASDSTAGERERKSLEPLLLNPAPRWLIVMGKFGAVFIFTLLATVLVTVVYVGLLALPQLQSFIGLRFDLDTTVIGRSVLLMLPVVFMAVGLEVLIASYSRSNKEAQTYVTYLSLAGFMPAMMLSILPVRNQAWMIFIPSIAQTRFIQTLTRGEALAQQEVILASAITLLVGLVALLGAIWLYNQERIITAK